MASLLHRLREEPPETVDDLRLLEAWAAIYYFKAWRSAELRWKGTSKKPIPPEWRRIGVRQDFLRRSNRHARHPMNAMLNYGYAVLESQVRIAIAEAGLDSTIGYLHVCLPGRQALAYDATEPYRPQVDWEVLAFIRSEMFTSRDFLIDSKGACRLHPDLARTVVRLATFGDGRMTAVPQLARCLLGDFEPGLSTSDCRTDAQHPAARVAPDCQTESPTASANRIS